jgi:outer membrane protein OmpA-like peptidoglycan-associated protein/tetratricopeptide (TPR) repeat protein
MTRFISFLILSFILSLNVSGQIKQADLLYNSNQFSQAIKHYKKALKGKNAEDATEKIAHSYRQIKEYDRAAFWYSQYLNKYPSNASVVFQLHYAEMLTNTGKYSEAQALLQQIQKSNPEHVRLDLLLRSLNYLNQLLEQNPLFEVINLNQINSKYADYSPVMHPDGLIFISEQQADYVGLNKNFNSNHLYSNIFLAKQPPNKIGEFKRPVLFSNLNTDFINGPVSFDENFKIIFLNRTDPQNNAQKIKKTDQPIRPRLLIAEMTKSRINSISEFNWNNSNYTFGHPALTPDGKCVYFISDMPGGFGGNDIYFSEKIGSEWSEPKNLGPLINTAGNETFPYVSSNGNFYFSSDGHPGLGGMDIFTAIGSHDQWSTLLNLAAPLNSSHDDFAVVFNKEETAGYFSSNRPGGKGSDDIYGFRNIRNWKEMKGKILFSENNSDPAGGINIILTTSEGKLIQSTTTEKNGSFHFRFLPPDQTFILSVVESQTEIKAIKKLFLADSNENLIKKTGLNEDGVFSFYNLPLSEFKSGDNIVDDTRIVVSGSLMAGDTKVEPLTAYVVKMVNVSGDTISTTITDAEGNFKFKNIPADDHYAFFLPENETKLKPGTRVVIADGNGNIVRTLYTNLRGEFDYQILSSDYFAINKIEEMDAEFKSKFKGILYSDIKSKTPAQNIAINLVDKNGNVFSSTKTDAKGVFQFNNLASISNYMIRIDSLNTDMKYKEIFFADKNGNVLTKLFSEGIFLKFEILPHIAFALNKILEDDVIEFKGKIFSDNKGKPAANKTLYAVNEQGEIVQTVKTDAAGNFKFSKLPADHHYLITIEDADNAGMTNYFLADSKGTILKEINFEKDQFKFRPLQSLSNSAFQITDSDTDLAFDIKGRIVSDLNTKKPVFGLKLTLKDDQGNPVRAAVTREDGYFRFANLKQGVYSVNPDSYESLQPLYLVDSRGNLIKKLGKDARDFDYVLLPSEMKKLSSVLIDDEPQLKALFRGKIFTDENGSTAPGGILVILMNKEDDEIQRAYTDAKGNFVFEKLPPDENYTFSIQDKETALKFQKLYVADKQGKIIKILDNKMGKFSYELLSADVLNLFELEENDTKLARIFSGKIFTDNQNKIPAAGAIVSLIDENGKQLQTAIVSKGGDFKFTKLPADDKYNLKISQPEDGKITFKSFFLYDRKGSLIGAVNSVSESFVFELLDYHFKSFSHMMVEDTQIKKKMKNLNSDFKVDETVFSKKSSDPIEVDLFMIYYSLNSFEINTESKTILDQIVKTMKQNSDFSIKIGGHSDSRGANSYNIILSEKRAQAVKNYLVENGIARSRITTSGFGFSKLLNHCDASVNCSEEQHFINRRAEIKLVANN